MNIVSLRVTAVVAAVVLPLLALVVLGTVRPSSAAAHPLGNFTVNRYSGIELAGNRVYVDYVLDLAEIPTFQEGDRVRAPGFAKLMAQGLVLRIDGRRAPLRARRASAPSPGMQARRPCSDPSARSRFRSESVGAGSSRG